jgi:oligoendopeptidase F
MTFLPFLAAAVLAATPAYHVDLGRYFPSPVVEQSERASLLTEVADFAATPPTLLNSPAALRAWLQRRDRLLVRLHRHDVFVYLRAERDLDDHADQVADDALSDAMDRLDRAAERTLSSLGKPRLEDWLGRDEGLATYRFFIETSLASGAGKADTPAAATMSAALETLANGYKSLANAAPTTPAGSKPEPEQVFKARWAPYAANEQAFAALLLPIVQLEDGRARERGAVGAPEAAFTRQGLTPTQVADVLTAVGHSTANQHFQAVLATAARKRSISNAALGPWALDVADPETPAPVTLPDALAIILAAERPMGSEYTDHYARLFDPAQHHLEWCQAPTCDRTGFSVGYAGVESGLFYGAYRGDVGSIRAVAHEAGHAVHRQFMNEHQPIAAYNTGPNLLFESFAIFNELLLLDHLYRTAPSPTLKAYYLHQLLGDMTFQIFGSAQETELEQSIYAGVRAGRLHSAEDLGALTLQVLSRYNSPEAVAPEMRLSWARNRLYFTDPLYDTNYLFAGLLAVEYLKRFEADPADFSGRYVALLGNGFDDAPAALVKRFLGVDLLDAQGLVADASAVITLRTSTLEALYACGSRTTCPAP